MASLLYKDFINNVCPDVKVWTELANNYISIPLGISTVGEHKVGEFTLGDSDGDTNMLIVGDKGSGKTNLIDSIVITMARMYSPMTLSIWLCDDTENGFESLRSRNGDYILPQISSILNEDSSLRLLEIVRMYRRIVEERLTLFDAADLRRLYSWNKLVLENVGTMKKSDIAKLCHETGKSVLWTSDDILPRCVLIVNEFQKALNECTLEQQGRIVEDIKFIAANSRRCGTHMIFTASQLTGTVPSWLLDSFTLKVALRCDKFTSMEVMSSLDAFKLERPGTAIVRSSDGSVVRQVMYDIPFIDKLAGELKAEQMYVKGLVDGGKYEG